MTSTAQELTMLDVEAVQQILTPRFPGLMGVRLSASRR